MITINELRVAKCGKYLRKLGNKIYKKMNKLGDNDCWEGLNEELNKHHRTMNEILLLLEKEGYWREGK